MSTTTPNPSPGARQPVFLLKTPSTPKDVYEEYFNTQIFPSRQSSADSSSDGDRAAHRYDPIFVPVLSHRHHARNLEILKSYFSPSASASTTGDIVEKDVQSNAFSGPGQKYGGIIFTSQRAVEAFGHILEQGDSTLSMYAFTKNTRVMKETNDMFTADIAASTSKDMILYTVGPATTRTLTPIRDKYLPSATIYGDQAGHGQALAHLILEHYNERYTSSSSTTAPKPGLLFLVGEQRRDIIPKTLMSTDLDEKHRIQVDELVVYETAERDGFEDAFRAAVEMQLRQQQKEQEQMWTVIFSPTGCDAVLRTVVNEASNDGDAAASAGSRRKCLIATIGPTTRDYLLTNYGFEPDVVARRPSAEGVGEGIREYLLGNLA
jgi:uroporphyrinogen-III synthase